jgi:hypothetical protein
MRKAKPYHGSPHCYVNDSIHGKHGSQMVKEKEHCGDSCVAATGDVASYPAWPLALCTYNPAIIGKLGTPTERLAGKAWLGGGPADRALSLRGLPALRSRVLLLLNAHLSDAHLPGGLWNQVEGSVRSHTTQQMGTCSPFLCSYMKESG